MIFPLRIAEPDQFALARDFLARASYDEPTLGRTLNIKDMGEFGHIEWDRVRFDTLPEALRWCINIFACGAPVGEDDSRAVCGEAAFTAFTALGLLHPARKKGSVICPVWLYPVDGFILASDLCHGLEGEPYAAIPDVVFPAIYSGTLRFLKLLPACREGEALDLCGGTGIGALHLSRTARAAATADVTARAAHFAAFNARLNAAPIAGFCGDLYHPVHDRQFDLISAHPPFVPATGQTMVYRDGGDTGEEIIRRIVQGLPLHLRSGGTCMILCVARDTREQTFEQRAQHWLGAAAKEFDVVFGLEHVMSVQEVVDSIRKRQPQFTAEAAKDLSARLNSLDTRQFVYGALVIRRDGPTANNGEAPGRIHLTDKGEARDFERLLAWRNRCRLPGFNEWLANSRPRLASNLQLTVRHEVRDRRLVPAEFMFSVEAGFQAALRLEGWIVPLVARLEGRASVAGVIDAARKADELPDGFRLEKFLELVQMMIARGFLEVDFAESSATR